ncbi:MAG TPA: TetR family transcriptional regulator C-terminal domain-containing protein, partial [Gemmatimonadales bacterium]|nr:TetR family transcriptional regulator C-terminal domain-containing protein [Gemmatimonadales bacterium]
ASGVPRGSFYHHFQDKQDFALQVADYYMAQVHAGLDACLLDTSRPPLERVRFFFEQSRDRYRQEGYLGCLLGGLGQELSGVDETFRLKIQDCMAAIADRLGVCLEEARLRGDLPADTDCRAMADRLVDCWEGAALRTRITRDPAPLGAMLDFYFRTAGAV